MNLPRYIATRIGQPSAENRPSVMVYIATIAVALSLAVMLLSVSVIQGFKVELSRKIIGVASEVEVSHIRSTEGNSLPVQPTAELMHLIREQSGCKALYPYASRGGVIRGKQSIEAIRLKGIGADYDTSFLESIHLEGELPRRQEEARHKDLYLSRPLAERLQLEVGDRIELLFIEPDGLPRRDLFKISGLFLSGMEEIDRHLCFTDLRNVQRLYGWQQGEVSGLELFLEAGADAEAVADHLNRELLYSELEESFNLGATSIQSRYRVIFDWLKTHDVNAAVILTIMLIVALFNMVSVLLILVLERTRMIGLLKSLGMANGEIRKIFLYRALHITLRGAVWGNLLALTLCLAQKWGHLLKLDAAGYLLSEVPIALHLPSWVGINLGTIVAILLLLIVPAGIVARIQPSETIRYE